MAQRITLNVTGNNDEERAYIASFLEANKPDGYTLIDGDTITIYAGNCYIPEFEVFLKKMSKDLRSKNLGYELTAQDVGYDRYEVSAKGVYHVGGYVVVGVDPDGCGPIKEYRQGRRVKVA